MSELQTKFKSNVLDGMYGSHAQGSELLTMDLDEVLHELTTQIDTIKRQFKSMLSENENMIATLESTSEEISSLIGAIA